MKKILKIIMISCCLQVAVSSCKANNINISKNSTTEATQSSESKIAKYNHGDVSDLKDCPDLIKKGNWEIGGRDEDWFDRGLIHSKGVSLTSNSNFLYTNKAQFKVIYIGPWQKTNLTHYEGSFFNKKKITEEKQIRFVAYQFIDYKNPPALNYHGDMRYFFESMNDQNKNIPEQSLSLLPDATPELFNLCVVKWNAKFGYNAVAEVKSKNPFSKNYLVPTGKIIEAKE